MRDHKGAVVGFGENPTDTPTPYLPYKQYKPYPAHVQYEQHRPYKQHAPYKPYKKYAWSELEPHQLFFSV
jgi:hypothetical protein